MWNELTFLWNELTILWNDLTTDWNDLTWNDLTMERNDRIPMTVHIIFEKTERKFPRKQVLPLKLHIPASY